MNDKDPQELLQTCIALHQQVFLAHRHAGADPALDAQAEACAEALAAIDADGTLTAHWKAALADFISDELRRHPPGSIDPYADVTPTAAPDAPPRSREELLTLDPEDLCFIVGDRLTARAAAGHALSVPERTVHALVRLDDEVQNGGVAQFLHNAGALREAVAEALEAVGAKRYAALWSQLDTASPASCEAFDDAYYRLYERTPLSRFIGRFIRRHIDDFTEE
ncbi:MAG: DUF4375 domain-containing protein [Clostridia bacterium]|nr:DUF4375 domain-containing protein [Clostridia bacterium]